MACKNPEGLVSDHPMVADEDFLESIVQGVSHVEGTGHIGRWNDYTVGHAVGTFICMEISVLHPVGVPMFFGPGRVKVLGHLFAHGAPFEFRYS